MSDDRPTGHTSALPRVQAALRAPTWCTDPLRGAMSLLPSPGVLTDLGPVWFCL
ncbi:MAG: hypothetical protein WCF33_25515 [Pseudonocardiaceae bacterium]